MSDKQLAEELRHRVLNDYRTRRALARESHYWFFSLYFGSYIKYETAPFQRDIFAITEDENIRTTVIEAFRDSAKSTIVSLSYPIWAIVGKQKRKFVLILADTQQQARQILANIRQQLEKNIPLRMDVGPFREPDDEWRAFSLVLPRYDARITVASVDQSVRGLRHGPHRPDLIICDDLENLNAVRTRESRNKLYDWLMGDIMPLGDLNTRLMVVGTRLHQDSLMMRLKGLIDSGKMSGMTRTYPLVDKSGVIAWPGKFPDAGAIEKLRKGWDERAWRREFLLEIVEDTDQVIDPTWIQRYPHLPLNDMGYQFSITSIDMAISESERADYTAIVSARVYEFDGERYVYILPDPVNERLRYPEMVERIQAICRMTHRGIGYVVVEDVAAQKGLGQDLEDKSLNVKYFKPLIAKRGRLALTAGKVKAARILFPEEGIEGLIGQLVNFGIESHDDLADAFSMLVIQSFDDELDSGKPNIRLL